MDFKLDARFLPVTVFSPFYCRTAAVSIPSSNGALRSRNSGGGGKPSRHLASTQEGANCQRKTHSLVAGPDVVDREGGAWNRMYSMYCTQLKDEN